MTIKQWETLVSFVNTYGIEKLEFENTDGTPFIVEDVAYMVHENKIVVLLD